MTGLKQRGEILMERMLISYWRRRAPITTPTPPFLTAPPTTCNVT